MRLKYIKLAGFKSFAEPIRLDFPSNIVCIVGPNGCGKSNTLDAIRWVMGESAARELRGGELNDVLFSGTERRKAVSQCSVELVFDNADHSLKGPWNRYETLSVKRVHHREQGSHFLLNQQRCRRRDIQALFDGTGLGPRSYALIGQGSINRIIESRPEQLRQMLEELAGIGHYRQRRRETLSRLEATRENLAQLTIQLTTWKEQAEQLAAQCEAARQHEQLTNEYESLMRTVFRGRYAQLLERLQKDEAELKRQQTAFAEAQQKVEAVDKALLLKQRQLPQLNRAVEEARSTWHRLDKALDLARQAWEQWQRQKNTLLGEQAQLLQRQKQLQSKRVALQAQQTELKMEQAELQQQIEALQPDHDALAEKIARLKESLNSAERHERQLHWQMDGVKQRLRSARDELARLQKEQDRLLQEKSAVQARLSHLKSPQPAAPLQLELDQLEDGLKKQSAAMEQLQHKLDAVLERLQDREAHLLQKREALQRSQAELDGLQAIQVRLMEAAGRNEAESSTPLLEQITVIDPAWQQAVECWLGDRLLQGRIVQDWDQVQVNEETRWVGIDEPAPLLDDGQARLHQVIDAPWPVLRQAQFVRLCETEGVPDFLDSLAEHESALTPSGVLYRRCERILPDSGTAQGALARQKRIEILKAQLERMLPDLEELEKAVDQLRAQRKHLAQQLRDLHQARENTQNALRQTQKRLLQAQESETQHAQRKTELKRQLKQLEQQLDALKPKLEQAAEQLESLEAERQTLQQQWRAAEQAVVEHRQQLRRARQQHEALARQLHTLVDELQQQAVTAARADTELTQLKTREDELAGMLSRVSHALTELQAAQPSALDEIEQQRDQAREVLNGAESALEAAQQELDGLHRQRHQAEQSRSQVEQAQARLELAIAQTQQQLQSLVQAAQEEAGLSAAQLRQLSLQEAVDLPAAERRLKKVRRALARMGPVNMTAVSAWEALQEKIDALQAQMADVEAAVDQLESSIRTIDRDSRKRLRHTWREAREHFRQMFPRIFRGGEADLVWLDPEADPLEGGLLVMARPPGKRNTRIQMLSGGEKTLTALALIFAFFEMRPAPFCVLDEVDAPLDDANVLRFCELVKGMAKRLQFILITHNKTTMQMAEQLLGITMNEPGVSRVVSVDVNAAMELIGEEAS